MIKKNIIRAGFAAFGEINTPRYILEKKYSEALREISDLNWDIIDGGLVIDDCDYVYADRAVKKLNHNDIDLLIVCIVGWIPTHAVIRVIDNFKEIPMILWSLAGWYENGKLISTADQAGATALNNTMKQLGYKYRFIYNYIGKSTPISKIKAFARAAYTKRRLRDVRIGSMGYRDMLLYGTTFDTLSIRREIGAEVETFEMLEMVRELNNVDAKELKETVDYCIKNWEFEKPMDIQIIEKGASYYLALKKKVLERKYEAITINDVDGMKKLENFPPAMILMLLADRLDLCTIPENDVLGNVTQLIVKYLTDQGAHYMEFYEFFEKSVLIGVPDYVPHSAVLGKVKMINAIFGETEGSILNVSKVKDGRVTMVRLIYENGEYLLHAALGNATQPPDWGECGWDDPIPQLPSLEVELDCSVDEFAQKVASQHTIIAYGDIMDELKQFSYLTGIEII